MSKPVILTAPRVSSELHIGNYFGALLPMIDMAKQHSDTYQINLFVADLHGLTTPINYKEVPSIVRQYLRTFVAAGFPLDLPDVHIYRQSYIPAHSELAWILDCFASFGQMRRMTQFKDKSAKLHDELISVGLFSYPVLMAADMLLYDATYVPVGDDQTQHLEFTRDIAVRMNKQFAAEFPDGLFVVPLPVPKQHEFFGKDQGLRIRDLQNPDKKMSKSDETGKGVIFLGDAPDVAAKKVMSAATDSLANIHFDYQTQPGVSNLLQILALLSEKPLDEVTREWEGKSSYGELKTTVAEKVKEFLVDFQSRLADVDEDALTTKLQASETAMNEIANQKLNRVQRAVGLRSL